MTRSNGNRRLPARQQVKRDAEIIADRARGHGWQTIADRHGLSKRHCQNIWADRDQGEPFVQSAAAQLRDEIDFLDAMIDELASLAESTTNDSVKLGAINSRINAQGRRLELKRAAGLMPWNLRRIGDAIEAKVLADQIAAVIKKHPGHSEILRELHEVLRDDEFRGELQLEWVRAINEQPQIEQKKTNTIEGKTTNRDSSQARDRAPAG